MRYLLIPETGEPFNVPGDFAVLLPPVPTDKPWVFDVLPAVPVTMAGPVVYVATPSGALRCRVELVAERTNIAEIKARAKAAALEDQDATLAALLSGAPWPEEWAKAQRVIAEQQAEIARLTRAAVAPPSGEPFRVVGTEEARAVILALAAVEERQLLDLLANRDHVAAQVTELQAANSRLVEEARVLRVAAGERDAALARAHLDREARLAHEDENERLRATLEQARATIEKMPGEFLDVKLRADEAERENGALKERVASLSAMVPGADEPWPLASVLRKLAEAADHLFDVHGCDMHGYETVMAARDSARRILAAFPRTVEAEPFGGEHRPRRDPAELMRERCAALVENYAKPPAWISAEAANGIAAEIRALSLDPPEGT